MHKPGWLSIWSRVAVLTLTAFVASRADDLLPVEHPECTFFSGEPERFMDQTVRIRLKGSRGNYRLSALTADVTRMLAYIPPDSPTYSFDQTQQTGSIDSYIFGALKANNITP